MYEHAPGASADAPLPDPRQIPFTAYSTRVREEWIDYNGHMNDACYAIVCSEASEALFDALDLGRAYQAATGRALYTVEARLRYLRETRLGDLLRAETRVVSADAKRVRVHHTLRGGSGVEVATGALLYLHVNQASGRVEALPAPRVALLTGITDR